MIEFKIFKNVNILVVYCKDVKLLFLFVLIGLDIEKKIEFV